MVDLPSEAQDFFVSFMYQRAWLTSLIAAVLGGLMAFMGPIALRIVFAVIGGLVAGLVGMSLGHDIYHTLAGMVLGVLLTLFVIYLLYRVYVFAIFGIGGVLGFVVTWTALAAMGQQPSWMLLSLAGLATALVALTMEGKFLILATTVAGALLAVVGGYSLLYVDDTVPVWETATRLSADLRVSYVGSAVWVLAAWGLVTLTGLLFQKATGRNA